MNEITHIREREKKKYQHFDTLQFIFVLVRHVITRERVTERDQKQQQKKIEKKKKKIN